MNSFTKYYPSARIFILAVMLSVSQFSYSQEWLKQNSPTGELLRNLFFVDEFHGWAAGRNGTMIRTTNGGEDWTLVNTGITSTIYDLFFLDRNTGWIVTFPFTPPYITKILKTTDGGSSWESKEYPDEFVFFRTVHFLDSLTGFIGGDFIARTIDGGVTWNRMPVDSSLISDYPVIRIKFVNDRLGYASGGSRDQAGVLWRTSDGGLNWSASGVSPDEVFDFFIVDSLNVLALSGDPEFIYPVAKVTTTNGGINWITEEIPFFLLSYAIDFRTDSEGWSASGIHFLFTPDGGQSWELIDTPDSVGVFDLQFVNRNLGFACGENGTVLRYFVPPDTTINPDLPVLYQNYPNPFSSETNIKLYLPPSMLIDQDLSDFNIEIFDVLGRKLKSLAVEMTPSGKGEVKFNGAGLASGIYFYKLKASGFSETKKMIVLR